MKAILVDIESYFDDEYSLGDSIAEYIADPRFEITAIGILDLRNDKMEPQLYHPENGKHDIQWGVDRLIEYANHGYRFIAHNALFDLSILALKAGIRPVRSLCTLAMARRMWPKQHNDLFTLAARLGLPPKGDTSQFSGVSFRQGLFKPDADTVRKLCEYLERDLQLGADIYRKLIPYFPDSELELISHTLKLATQPKLIFDIPKAQSLVQAMNQEMIRAVDGVPPKIRTDAGFGELLSAALARCGENPNDFKKPGKLGEVWAVSKKDQQRDTLMNHPDETVRKLMNAKAAIKSWPLHTGRVKKLINTATVWGGMMPVPTHYYGCHTGRWSGTEGINLLNMPKRGHPLLMGIRGCIKAPPGYVLLIQDYATIEPIVLSIIAGQEDMTEAFRQRRDIYSEFIMPAAGIKVYKNSNDDKIEWWRQAGKVTVLGAGYGAGKDGIYIQAQGKYSLEMCDLMINQYRARYPKIPRLWHDLERAVRVAIRGGQTEIGGCLVSATAKGDRVRIRLPSGRDLMYQAKEGPRGVETCEWGVCKPQQPGYWTENVVQATARDLLTPALLKCEEMGLPIVYHCYDELVALAPEKDSGLALARMEGIMCSEGVPEWAKGWPIAVEGKITESYGK